MPMTKYELEELWRDPSHWKLGLFYFCRQDPRIIVPKRRRSLGWTVTFARPLAIPVALLLPLAIMFGVVKLCEAAPQLSVVFLLLFAGLLGWLVVLGRAEE